MGTAELRSSIHAIVDRIQNEQLLQALHDFLKTKDSSQPGHLWNTLSEEQKQEVLLAYEEAEDEANLVDREEVFNKPA